MDQQSVNRIELYWKYNFSCLSSDFEKVSPSLIMDETKNRSELEHIRILRFKSKTVVSLTQKFLNVRSGILHDILESTTLDLQICSQRIAELMEVAAPRLNRLFYAPHSVCSKTEASDCIHLLTTGDLEGLKKLEETADQKTWLEAGSCLEEGPIFGYVHDGKILAIAGFVPWAYKSIQGHRVTDIANIQVYTSPEARKKGFAKSVLSHLVEFAHMQGYMSQFQVDSKNLSSIRLANSIGFEDFGGHFSITVD
jgi:GNAT superfamily N-acetyltransferase